MTEQLEPKTEEFTQIPPTPVLTSPVFTEYAAPAGKPVSVKVIAILFLVGAVVEIGGFFMPNDASETLNMVSRFDSIVFATLLSFTGVRLMQFHPSARSLAIILIIVRFVTSIPLSFLALKDEASTASATIPIDLLTRSMVGVNVVYALYLATLIYLLCRPAVKAAFARS